MWLDYIPIRVHINDFQTFIYIVVFDGLVLLSLKIMGLVTSERYVIISALISWYIYFLP